MAADDDQLRLFRVLDELASRVIADHKATDFHVRVILLPARQLLSQCCILRRLHRQPVHAQKVARSELGPCVQGDEIHAPARRLVERDRRSKLGRGGAVDPDEDRRLCRMRHQRIFVVNDRHRAVRVLDDAGAYRTEQFADCTMAATSHHDHVCSLRHVDESGNSGRVVDLASDLQGAGVPLHRCNDFHRTVNGLVGPLLLPFAEAGRKRRVRQGSENTADDVDQDERCAPLRGVACGPIHSNLRGG